MGQKEQRDASTVLHSEEKITSQDLSRQRDQHYGRPDIFSGRFRRTIEPLRSLGVQGRVSKAKGEIQKVGRNSQNIIKQAYPIGEQLEQL